MVLDYSEWWEMESGVQTILKGGSSSRFGAEISTGSLWDSQGTLVSEDAAIT